VKLSATFVASCNPYFPAFHKGLANLNIGTTSKAVVQSASPLARDCMTCAPKYESNAVLT